MNKYEELLNDADKLNVTVTNQFDLSDTRFKGLYCDGTIAISKNMNAESEKACILAEEFLAEALQYYRNKYGLCTTVDNYVIYFEPALGIFEQI